MYNHSYSLTNVGGLISSTYILAIAWAIGFVFIFWLIANIVRFDGGKNPRDPFRRRVWFYILLVICGISFFLWNFLYVVGLIKGAPAQDKFTGHIAITTGIVFILYFVLVFIISKFFPRSKIGTVFPSKK
jgi:drug/metabolite transporter (DMT)-like permease